MTYRDPLLDDSLALPMDLQRRLVDNVETHHSSLGNHYTGNLYGDMFPVDYVVGMLLHTFPPV
ncbi:hypothetical protein BLA29_004688 [Euroglyphus maynei]|uniref:Uncharacterized protein n=1 Tax=Euroglyphus maynei TaxID=6958 RepID=A0A1Y3BVD4_EURMA|nr:hypothetical protein BLA29_004688 [Euroglyphus maynei]